MKKCLGYVYTSGVMTSAPVSTVIFHQIRFPIHHIFAQHKCSTQKKLMIDSPPMLKFTAKS
jgi:hypothetical protein